MDDMDSDKNIAQNTDIIMFVVSISQLKINGQRYGQVVIQIEPRYYRTFFGY